MYELSMGTKINFSYEITGLGIRYFELSLFALSILSLFTKRAKRVTHFLKKSERVIRSFLPKNERFARKPKERIPIPAKKGKNNVK